MTPLEIKAKLILEGVKLREIAQEANVTTSFVSMVIHGKKKSQKVQKIISKKLNVPFETLWETTCENEINIDILDKNY